MGAAALQASAEELETSTAAVWRNAKETLRCCLGAAPGCSCAGLAELSHEGGSLWGCPREQRGWAGVQLWGVSAVGEKLCNPGHPVVRAGAGDAKVWL